MTTVGEAIAVLEGAAKTPRARAALSALQSEFESTDRGSDSKSSSEKPSFPDATSVAEHFGDALSARGGHSSDGARGLATARKGS